MNSAYPRGAEGLAGIANPIYPFDQLQSFALENPLFCWFVVFAFALGVWIAITLNMAHRKSRTMALSLNGSTKVNLDK